MTRTTSYSLVAMTMLLFITTGCATTTVSSPALTKDLAVVAASAMLVPSPADVVASNAIWDRPDQASEITEVAITAAPDQMQQIRRAAILAAPDQVDQILAAADRAAKRPAPAPRMTIPRTSDLLETVARADR